MGYDIRWQRGHELDIRAAGEQELLEPEQPPFVSHNRPTHVNVTYQVKPYTNSPNKEAIIYPELHTNEMDEVHGADIELLSPHFRAVRTNDKREMPDGA